MCLRTKIIACFLLLFVTSCKHKECKSSYTISGYILNGTTGGKFYNVGITFTASDGDNGKGKPGTQFKDLGKVYTDSQGFFSFTYPCSDFPGNQIYINSDLMELGYISYNTSYSQTWYKSSLGTVEVSLKSANPLKENDTLYLAYPLNHGDEMKVDTFTQSSIPVRFNVRTPLSSINFFWGRGSKNLIIKEKNVIIKYGGLTNAVVRGDPYIDEFELKY